MRYRAKKIYLSCDEQTVHAWSSYIRAHIDEAVRSLEAENIRHEMWFLGRDTGGLFLIGAADADDHERAAAAFARSELSVDAVHRAFKENWDRGRSMKLAVDPEREPRFDNCELLLDIRVKK